jgi:hypothetical protein
MTMNKPVKSKTGKASRIAHQRLVISLARCEGCGKTKDAKPYPKGWYQSGKSKWGKKYQKSGLAWWCDKCPQE